MQPRLLIKAILITLSMPIVGIIFIPYIILHQSGITHWPEFSLFNILISVLIFIVIAILLFCIWEFAFIGKGTLAPLDPPKMLVVSGIYRYTRNPMYLSIVIILLLEVILFENFYILLYAIISFFSFHIFVLYYEEPHLGKQFGGSYHEYCRAVPRWGIALKPFIK